jgi:hypothetical protein
MESVTDALKHFEGKGYDKNIVPRYDHFEVDSGAQKLFPPDFEVDDIFRYENTSDPDDQAILYAISSSSHHLKGVFLESYGLGQEPLSKGMLEKLKHHADLLGSV